MPIIAAAVGLLLVGGILAIVAGARRVWAARQGPSAESLEEVWARLSRRPPGARGRRRDVLLVGSLAAGFVIAALTGWVLAIPLAPAVILGLPALLSIPTSREVELLEALDRWVRNLSATLSTGKSITDAIRLSRRHAPETISADLDVLVVRLNNRWDTRDALMRFADALDSPDSDAVIAALILAANRGSTGAATTLHELAESLQAQLKARRVIETERAKPYLIVRQVTVISLVTLALVMIIGAGYFAPYATALGQLILVPLIAAYVGSLILMRRRARTRPRARILIGVHR